MREEIRKILNVIKTECTYHMGKNSCCDGCGFRVATGECFLGMNPKLPCNWDLGADLGVNLVDNLGKTKEVTTMAKNLIPEVCKLLGIEVEEIFKLKSNNQDYITSGFYLINKYGDVYWINDGDKSVNAKKQGLITLSDLVNGCYEIIKLPWQPKGGEKCWTFFAVRTSAGAIRWKVWSIEWAETPDSIAKLEKGWVFRNREEAEAALPAVAKELGVEYEL